MRAGLESQATTAEMNLALSETLARLRTWERKKTTISGSLFTNSQELQMTFVVRINIDRETIRLTREGDDLDIRLTLTPAMALRYNNQVRNFWKRRWSNAT